jgi:hypothetical protein
MYGQYATRNEIEILLPKDKFYDIYAIGTEECMRGILTSFFYNDKSAWEKLAKYYLYLLSKKRPSGGRIYFTKIRKYARNTFNDIRT